MFLFSFFNPNLEKVNFHNEKITHTKAQKVNWAPYMKNLECEIKKNWTPVKTGVSSKVVITFVIGKQGELLSHKITTSSNNFFVDKEAINAIKKTVFAPLPKEYSGNSIPIEFTFNYNATGN